MILVCDTETGGLDPEEHSILSFAAKHRASGETFEVFIREPILRVQADALAINRIDLREYKEKALGPTEALSEFYRWVGVMAREHEESDRRTGRVPQIVGVGHNLVAFDMPMIKRWYRQAGVALTDFRRDWTHRVLDTMIYARCLADAGVIEPRGFSLEALCDYFGIYQDPMARHTALGDVEATDDLLTALHTAAREAR